MEQIIREIKTPIGILYIEEWTSKREEEDRIKIFDSKKRYLTYWSLEVIEFYAKEEGLSSQEFYNKWTKGLKECTDIRVLLDALCIDYAFVSMSLGELVDAMRQINMIEGLVEEEDTESVVIAVLSNEFINIIGAHWIIVRE